MTKSTVTLELLRSVARELNARSTPARVIDTQEQANTMTAQDRFGYVWRVGDEYYEGTPYRAVP